MSVKRTPLYEVHKRFDPVWVEFAGYEMPVRYKAGTIAEHRHTRESASLFDVSHMGQVIVTAKSGDESDSAAALEGLVPADILGLPEWRQRYGVFTTAEGGILDDMLIARKPDHLFLVVNASRMKADVDHLQRSLRETCNVRLVRDRALIAIQGPCSEMAMKRLAPEVAGLRFMDVGEFSVGHAKLWVARSGYTGEDGFEISVPSKAAIKLWEMLVEMDEVMPAGLGARDTLRLEAGLCLYGSDIDHTTSPVEAGLVWSIQKVRRTGGSREGGFPGSSRISFEIENGTSRQRVGLRPEARVPIRRGARLFGDAAGANSVGEVTSGGFGPTVNGPVSMGYVGPSSAQEGTQVFGEVRGRLVPVRVAALPFVPPNFRR